MTTDTPPRTMKLYYHPISTTSRPIMMFAADHEIALDYCSVDLFSGEQTGAAFTAINPNQAVPVQEDGDFRMTESSAILKYLADRVDSPAYPKGLRERARVNEAMDWFNTGLSREFAYGFVQVMPDYRRADVAAQAATFEWARPRALRLLGILDQQMIGPQRSFVLGEQISLADYLGMGILTLGEAAGRDYARWPNLSRWLATLKARPSFGRTHDAFYTYLVAPSAGQAHAAL